MKAMWCLSVLRHCVGIMGMSVDSLNLTILELINTLLFITSVYALNDIQQVKFLNYLYILFL